MSHVEQEWLTMFATIGIVTTATVFSWALAQLWTRVFPK